MDETYIFSHYQMNPITRQQEIMQTRATGSNDGGTTVTELCTMFLEFIRESGYVNKVNIQVFVHDDSDPDHSITLNTDQSISTKFFN